MPAAGCSVIVIARNSEAVIESCLESLFDQTSQPMEIIVVDNGSTDSTAKVASSLGARVVSQSTPGRGIARNTGVREARGELVVFIDSDCKADRNWLDLLLNAKVRMGAAGVAGNVVAENPKKLIPGLVEMLVRDKPHFATWNIIYDRKTLFDVGLFNEKLGNAEDVELAWRVLDRGYKIAYEDKAIVYHKHPERLRDFLYQQFDYGRWSIQARKCSGRSTWKSKVLIFLSPLSFFKHIPKARDHPVYPFILTLSSMTYGLGTLEGLVQFRQNFKVL